MEKEHLTIVLGQSVSELEWLAAKELKKYLEVLFPLDVRISDKMKTCKEAICSNGFFLLGNPQSNPIIAEVMQDWPEVSDQGLFLRSVCHHGQKGLIVGGGSSIAVLWATCELSEKIGVRFTLQGDVLSERRDRFIMPDLNLIMEPVFRVRGFRGVNDFVSGPESWGVEDYHRAIDQLVKMKFNMIYLSFFPWQPWLNYEFRGQKKQTFELFFGWKYPITDEMVGREHLGEGEYFTNPDLAGCETIEEKYKAGKEHIHNIIKYAKTRGMRTAISFTITDFPDEFKDRFLEWAEPPSVKVDIKNPHFSRLGVAGYGFDLKNLSWQNLMDPSVQGLAKTVLKSVINEYPEVDDYIIWPPEFRAPVSDYEKCWQELDEAYGIEKITPLKELLCKVSSRFYHSPGRAENEFKGDIEFLYFLDKILRKEETLKETVKPNTHIIIGDITEELFPILPRVLPASSGIMTTTDYTLSKVVERLEVLEPFREAKFSRWFIVSLQDDNVGVQPQVHVKNLGKLMPALWKSGFEGFGVRYWAWSPLEPSASYLAKISWNVNLTPDRFYEEYIKGVCGEACLPELKQAFEILDENTAFVDDKFIGEGFQVPNMMSKHFKASKQMPPEIMEASSRYEQALKLFQKAHSKATSQGQRYIDYFISRLEFVTLYYACIQKVRELGVVYREFDEARSNREEKLARERANDAKKLAEEAVNLSRKALENFAKEVRDRSDRGSLAQMNRDLYLYLKALRHIITLETDLWHM